MADLDTRRRGFVSKDQMQRLPALTVCALVVALLCDLPTYLRTSGGVSGSAVLSIGLAALGVITLPVLVRLSDSGRADAFLPMLFYALWCFVLWTLLSPTKEGAQEVSILAIFVTVGLITASISDRALVNKAYLLLSGIGWVLGFVYLTAVLVNGLGANGPIGRRSFALEALVLIGAFTLVPKGRSWIERWLPFFLFSIICLSLSRTAMVVGGILVVIKLSRSGQSFRFRRVLLIGGIAVGLFVWALNSIPVVRERFEGGDQAFEIGGFTLSTQGRSDIWGVVLNGVSNSWVVGHGPGSVRSLIQSSIPTQTEPHNDFLRSLYNYGAIGLSLFILSLLCLVLSCVANARRPTTSSEDRPRQLSAALCLISFLFGSLTDNAVVYSFVVAPVALVVGLALSAAMVSRSKENLVDVGRVV